MKEFLAYIVKSEMWENHISEVEWLIVYRKFSLSGFMKRKRDFEDIFTVQREQERGFAADSYELNIYNIHRTPIVSNYEHI